MEEQAWETAEAVEIGIPEVDAEHSAQLRLLMSIENAIARGDSDEAFTLLQGFHDYSDAHFGSEQVFMRLHAYPGYRMHELEHGELIAELRRLLALGIVGCAAELARDPKMIRRTLLRHIRTSDRAFANWIHSREY